jgi:two-component system, cell cycle sensor histidine kinase and response regulator CckA
METSRSGPNQDEALTYEALRDSQERFRATFEQAAVGLAHVGLDGRWLHVNQKLCDIVGYSRDELLQRTFQDVTHPDHVATDVKEVRRILENQLQTYSTEKRYIRKDGSVVWINLTTSLVRTRSGEPSFFITVVEDIDNRKHAEEALRESEEQVRQLQKLEAVGQLAGGVAHDFNNLLTVILGRAQMLLAIVKHDERVHAQVQVLESTARRAATLTTQLLAFSRKQILQPRVIDLNTLVANMEDMVRRLIGEHIGFVFVPGSALGRVKADPGPLEQVILNLAVNARDAMPDGGCLTVTTANVELDATSARRHAGARPGQYVMLTVSDTGIGMDAATQRRIFEPFFTTKPVGKGTGLGLATVYGIVKQSGGDISVSSELGVGTVFNIYLPRVAQVADLQPLRGATDPLPGGTETVLLVEDDDELRQLAQEVLEGQGYTVFAAGRPRDATAIATRHAGTIHLLLTDVVMPEMSGPDLARDLVSVRRSMKVLFMSGYTNGTIVHHGVLNGGTAFLQKPFSAGLLAQKVRLTLDTSADGIQTCSVDSPSTARS